MKIYRVAKDKEKKNDMTYGLVGYLAESKRINFYGVLIKNRNSSLLLPGKLFARTCNLNPKVRVNNLMYGYRNWSSLMEMYSFNELNWIYEQGYSVYEIDIQPKYIITSPLDRIQCVFDCNKCMSITKLSKEEVINSYNGNSLTYISIDLVDKLIDDSLTTIKFLIEIKVPFILSFRDQHNYNETDPKNYMPKTLVLVEEESDVWNKLDSITKVSCDNTEDNINSLMEIYYGNN